MNIIKHATCYSKHVKALDQFKSEPSIAIIEIKYPGPIPLCDTYRVELRAIMDFSVSEENYTFDSVEYQKRNVKMELSRFIYGEVIDELRKVVRAIYNSDRLTALELSENILEQLEKIDE